MTPAASQTAAGLLSGAISIICVHPLDVVKTRMQVHARPHESSWRLLCNIARTEGIRHGLYRGCALNVAGGSVSWGVYFGLYGWAKRLLSTTADGGQWPLSTLGYWSCAAFAGTMTAVLTNPIWVVKTRILASERSAQGAYRGFFDGVAYIARNEGIRGFYRGLLPSLFGVTQGSIQFMVYEKLKLLLQQDSFFPQSSLSNAQYVLCSATSKIVATAITYPYQVLRSRSQMHRARTDRPTVRQIIREMARQPAGLVRTCYSGLVPNLVRVVPHTAVTLLVYENAVHALS